MAKLIVKKDFVKSKNNPPYGYRLSCTKDQMTGILHTQEIRRCTQLLDFDAMYFALLGKFKIARYFHPASDISLKITQVKKLRTLVDDVSKHGGFSHEVISQKHFVKSDNNSSCDYELHCTKDQMNDIINAQEIRQRSQLLDFNLILSALDNEFKIKHKSDSSSHIPLKITLIKKLQSAVNNFSKNDASADIRVTA